MHFPLWLAAALAVAAQSAAAYSPFAYGEGQAKGLQWFKNAKLGMFIHYGAAAAVAVERASGARGEEREKWRGGTRKMAKKAVCL